MYKKFLLLLLAALLVGILSCSGGESSSGDNSDIPSESNLSNQAKWDSMIWNRNTWGE